MLRRALTTGLLGAAIIAAGAPLAAGAPRDDAPASAGAESQRFVPGELIVRFAPSSARGERARALEAAGADAERPLELARTRLVAVEGGVRAAIRELEEQHAIRYAEPNYLRELQELPNDPLFGQLWGLHNTGQPVNGTGGTADADIDAPEAWDLELGDPATVVAVIDTGVDPAHPDLAPQLWENPGEAGALGSNGVDDDANGLVDDRRGYDFYDGDADPHDEEGHGTHVAGTILARGGDGIGVTGVAQRASLMTLRVCGSYEGDGCTDAAIIDAIDYAGEMGADVVNGSLGGPGASQAIADAIAAHPGTLYAWAAGNGGADGIGDDNDASTQYPCQADEAPGFTAENSVCVAASNRFDNLAGFSNYGDEAVDLAAPGTTTLSASAGRRVFSESFTASDFAERWTNDPDDTWARVNEPPLSSFGIADSPGGDYAPAHTNRVTSQPFALPPGYGACTLSYYRSIGLAAGDEFQIQVLLDGAFAAASKVFSDDDNGARRSFFELGHAFDDGGEMRVRLVLVSNADGAQADGVHMDDIALDCAGTPSDGGYVFLQGTSMATPHVAGTAALLAAREPEAGAGALRSALLDSVDPVGSLAGKVATGGRLNARAALERIDPPPPAPPSAPPPPPDAAAASDTAAPQTTIERAPRKRVRKRRVAFAFASGEPAAAFECRLNRNRFAPCASPKRVRAKRGRNVFRVRAINAAGNADPTPARARFTVKRRR